MKVVLLKSILFILFLLSFVIKDSATAQNRFRGFMLRPDVEAQDIIDIKGWGANFVRYQLGWNGPVDTASEAEYKEWLNGALDRLDGIITVAQANGIKVLINLHTPPGGYVSRVEPAQYRIFSEAASQRAFIEVWEIIAKRYKDNPGVWGYQLVNEPAIKRLAPGLDDWNKLALKAAKKIREFDTTHTIVMTPHYGDTARINKLKVLRVKNVAYSVHMYFPRQVTNQGIFPGFPYGVEYPSSKYKKSGIEKYLKKLIKFKNDHKAKILIHEFSVARWAPNGSGARFLNDAISIFEKYKFNWVYHAFREANVWSLEHVNDRNSDALSTELTDRAIVVRKYLAKNQ